MTNYIEPNFPALLLTEPVLRDFDRKLMTVLSAMSSNVKSILDGGISFTDNMDIVLVTYTSNAVANTEDTIAHTLGKVPTGYIPVSKNKAADVYNTSSATKTNLLLKCSVSSATIKLLVF